MPDPKMNFSNQFNLLTPEALRPVTLIGAGAVGSYVAIELAKMGVPKLIVYDDDSVESPNIPMSAYRQKDLGRPKLEALREIVEEASGLIIDARPVRYVEGPIEGSLEGAVVVCVDTMEARQAIWRYVEGREDIDLLIDTRTAAELLWVFAIDPDDPDDIKFYRHYVAPSTQESATHACGRHGLAPVSLRAAAAVGSNLTSWRQSGRKVTMHREHVLQIKTLTV